MKNPIKELKKQQHAMKIMKQLDELKEKAKIDYKWYGLACASGMITDISQVTDIKSTIENTKKQFPEITTEQQLDELLESYAQAVKHQAEKHFGKWYTNKVMGDVE